MGPGAQEVREVLYLYCIFFFILLRNDSLQARGGGHLLYRGLKLGIDSVCEGCEQSNVLIMFMELNRLPSH